MSNSTHTISPPERDRAAAAASTSASGVAALAAATRLVDDGDPHVDPTAAPAGEWRFYEPAQFSWSGDVLPTLGLLFYGYGESPDQALDEAAVARREDFAAVFIENDETPAFLVAVRSIDVHHVAVDSIVTPALDR